MLDRETLNATFEIRGSTLYRRSTGTPAATGQQYGYTYSTVGNKSYRDYRIIWVMLGRPAARCIDHIDGDPTNNHPDNLRAATIAQNAQNSKLSARNTSGAKGVSWTKFGWRVMVQANKKQHCVGSFRDLEFAELVAIMAREKYHGEFARHA